MKTHHTSKFSRSSSVDGAKDVILNGVPVAGASGGVEETGPIDEDLFDDEDLDELEEDLENLEVWWVFNDYRICHNHIGNNKCFENSQNHLPIQHYLVIDKLTTGKCQWNDYIATFNSLMRDSASVLRTRNKKFWYTLFIPTKYCRVWIYIHVVCNNTFFILIHFLSTNVLWRIK